MRPAADRRRRHAEPQRGRRAKPVRLASLAGDDSWREQADRLIDGDRAARDRNLFMHMALLNALDLRLRAAEIVVTGEGARAEALLAAARTLPALDRIVLHARSPASLPRGSSGAGEGRARQAAPQAFVCVGETCSLPVTDPAGLVGARRSSTRIPERANRRRDHAFSALSRIARAGRARPIA